jgi:hypothetical protein
VGQEDETDDDFKQARQHACAAIRHETLGPEGEHHLGNTRKEREASDEPSGCEKRFGGFNEAHYTQCDEKNARNSEPNFLTFVHNDEIDWLTNKLI